MKKLLIGPALLLTTGALILAACQDDFESCENTLSCGDGDGGSSGSGGGETGSGGDAVGGSDGSGGKGPDACDGACSGDTPVCDEGECVGCLDDGDCPGDTLVCDTDAKECVGCVENADCWADAPVCDNGACSACVGNDDCSDYGDSPVCDDTSGSCVECLSEDDCAGKVCNPKSNTCTDFDARVLTACQECVHDTQCQDGQLCVQQEVGGTVVGNFCTWTKEAHVGSQGSCLDNGRPFAKSTVDPVTSTDGASAVLCVLRPTTASCLAYNQHSQLVSGCDAVGDDSACGAPGVNDGICQAPQGGGSTRCTYACLSDEDCKLGAACEAAGYCSL